MDIDRLWMLTDRAISLLNSVDENKPEQAIKLVDMAVSDLIEVRAALGQEKTNQEYRRRGQRVTIVEPPNLTR